MSKSFDELLQFKCACRLAILADLLGGKMELVLSLLVVQGLLFVPATVLTYLSKSVSSNRKFAQILFSFLVPILGPFITIMMHLQDRHKPGQPSSRYMGQSIDEMPMPMRFWLP